MSVNFFPSLRDSS